MDPYLYSAGQHGEGFKIDDIQDLNEFARTGEEKKLARTAAKPGFVKWLERLLPAVKETRLNRNHTGYSE